MVEERHQKRVAETTPYFSCNSIQTSWEKFPSLGRLEVRAPVPQLPLIEDVLLTS